jgi:hypothetical protein
MSPVAGSSLPPQLQRFVATKKTRWIARVVRTTLLQLQNNIGVNRAKACELGKRFRISERKSYYFVTSI